MISKILNKLGYVHISEVEPEYLSTLGEPSDYPLIKDMEDQFFKDLAGIDRVDDFLDATMLLDMQREFNTQTDQERHLVKGGYGRTLYFKRGITKARGLKGK